MLVCHFVDPDLGVEKEGAAEQGDIDFEMGGRGGGLRHLLHTSIRASRNIQAEPFSFIFFLDKKNNF